MRIPEGTGASLDHIFTRSFFKDREDSIRPKDYNQEWNCQPMHKECNKNRGGQIYGFPLFICSCHWLQIDGTSQDHVLMLHYQVNGHQRAFPVTTEKHRFVSGNLSTGEHGALFGGSSEVEISSVWSMGELGPGKKGVTGEGQLGHALPRVGPEEVPLFNRLEKQRIAGNPAETIERFNRRMDPMRIQVHFEVH